MHFLCKPDSDTCEILHQDGSKHGCSHSFYFLVKNNH